MTVGEVCHELNNYFDRNMPKLCGAFRIVDGKIVTQTFTDVIHDDQYFRIMGSVFNDGVWKNTDKLELTDENFKGNVWLMAVPKEIEDICSEMDAWETKNGEQAMSPFTSESFGGYSYSKGSKAGQYGSSSAITAFDMFASRLNKWRKMR